MIIFAFNPQKRGKCEEKLNVGKQFHYLQSPVSQPASRTSKDTNEINVQRSSITFPITVPCPSVHWRKIFFVQIFVPYFVYFAENQCN